jgi:rhodanese-related sulfurtransferase
MTTGIIIAVIVAVFITFGIYNKRGITMINAESAKKMIDAGGVKILDVRTPEEFKGGHLKGAVLIPVSEINQRISELASVKDRDLLVYCHSGGRSSSASQILRGHGFTKVHNLQGGVTAWSSMGYQLLNGEE